MHNGLIIIVLLIFTVSCNSEKEEERIVNPEDYFSFETESYEMNGEKNTFLSPIIITRNDSLGNFIRAHERRFSYILGNRIDRDSLKTFYPDTAKVALKFKENLKKPRFNKNFRKLALLEPKKDKFSKDEIMNIAGRFFLIIESPNGNGYATRVCRGINGLEKESDTDYTVLESIMFEAIFNRVIDNKMPKADFLISLQNYQKAIDTNVVNLEIVRESIFSSMASDVDLNSFIFEYLERNKNNIPFRIE